MPKLIVTPLSAIEETIRLEKPSHMVTLLSPEQMIETPNGFPVERHLKIGMHDIVDVYDGSSPPDLAHVKRLLDFARTWDARAPMLIHCWAGVSRSMAAAYTVLCDRLGEGSEIAIAKQLRARAKHAHPNRLFIQLADQALHRKGMMIRAIQTIGHGAIVTEGVCTDLPLTLDPV
jgi:predicted protein tyrosine phosphatase